jgi:coiled-coil domain-containing protein 130
MSAHLSLAATQADGYYYNPAGFDPAVKGRHSFNALAHTHPLGERAKRLASEGILVIRFEMPHNAWCTGCGKFVARGVRFNADKKRVGSYHSTAVWEFDMKCTSCETHYVIRTDPKGADYEFVSGIKRKAMAHDDVTAAARVTLTQEERRIMASDTFFKLEHATDDARRAEAANRQLAALMELQDARYKDGYASNAALRAAARATRRADAELVLEGKAAGLAIPLLPRHEDDALRAAHAARAAALGDRAGVAAALTLPAGSLPAAPRWESHPSPLPSPPTPLSSTRSGGDGSSVTGGLLAGSGSAVAQPLPAALVQSIAAVTGRRRRSVTAAGAVTSLLAIATGGGGRGVGGAGGDGASTALSSTTPSSLGVGSKRRHSGDSLGPGRPPVHGASGAGATTVRLNVKRARRVVPPPAFPVSLMEGMRRHPMGGGGGESGGGGGGGGGGAVAAASTRAGGGGAASLVADYASDEGEGVG